MKYYICRKLIRRIHSTPFTKIKHSQAYSLFFAMNITPFFYSSLDRPGPFKATLTKFVSKQKIIIPSYYHIHTRTNRHMHTFVYKRPHTLSETLGENVAYEYWGWGRGAGCQRQFLDSYQLMSPYLAVAKRQWILQKQTLSHFHSIGVHWMHWGYPVQVVEKFQQPQ